MPEFAVAKFATGIRPPQFHLHPADGHRAVRFRKLKYAVTDTFFQVDVPQRIGRPVLPHDHQFQPITAILQSADIQYPQKTVHNSPMPPWNLVNLVVIRRSILNELQQPACLSFLRLAGQQTAFHVPQPKHVLHTTASRCRSHDTDDFRINFRSVKWFHKFRLDTFSLHFFPIWLLHRPNVSGNISSGFHRRSRKSFVTS